MYFSGVRSVPDYFGNTTYQIGQPINLAPVNPYGMYSANIPSSRGVIRVNGRYGQVNTFIDLLEKLRKLKEKKETVRSLPLDIEVGVSGVGYISPIQKIISSSAYKFNSVSSGYIASENGLNYFAAGIMLFCMNGGVPSVILFNYYDLGLSAYVYCETSGNITNADNSKTSADETLRKTAIREAQEESSDLFNINISSISQSKSIDIPKKSGLYRCYFIGLGDVNTTEIRNNFNANKGKLTDASWKVMDSVEIFPISSLYSIPSNLRSDTKVVIDKIINKYAPAKTSFVYENNLCRGNKIGTLYSGSSGTQVYKI